MILSLTPLDVGFDLRLHDDILVELSPSYVEDGRISVRFHRGSEEVELRDVSITEARRALTEAGYHLHLEGGA